MASHMGPVQTLIIAVSSILILFFHQIAPDKKSLCGLQDVNLVVHKDCSYLVLQLKSTTNFSFLFKIVCPAYTILPSFIAVYMVHDVTF